MKIIKYFLAILLTFVLSGCVTTPKPTMTPLEIQSLQSREYEAKKEVVFRSVISVFQDIGYTIKNADNQTGLIFAESSSNSNYISKLFGMNIVSQTKATAFIEKIGSKTKARLNFVEVKKSSEYSGRTDRQDTPIIDAQFYQNAFEKIENEIFIRSKK